MKHWRGPPISGRVLSVRDIASVFSKTLLFWISAKRGQT